jgi:Tautomerase enzyme
VPLLRFDVIKGRSEEALTLLLDVAHAAMVEAFGVPESDRYQIVHEHPRGRMRLQDTGLGFTRSDDAVVLQIVSRPRPITQKQTLYRLLSERLNQACGLGPEDLIVSIIVNGDEDWSFGKGEAQFLTGALR